MEISLTAKNVEYLKLRISPFTKAFLHTNTNFEEYAKVNKGVFTLPDLTFPVLKGKHVHFEFNKNRRGQ